MARDYLKFRRPVGAHNQELFAEETLIGRESYLGWPVDAYRIFVPIISDDPLSGDLNPFERLVVSILSVESPLLNTPHAIAEAVCLEPDFVQDILLRLRGRGYVGDDYTTLSSHCRKVLAEGARGDEAALPKMQTAFVFREAVTGRMLPSIYRIDGETLETMDYDDVGRRRPIVLKRSRDTFPPPSQEEVRRVLVDCRKRKRDYGDSATIPPYVKFEVLGTPEQYFLLCPIGVRRIDGEERIGDPFGLGYSLVLEAAFEDAYDSDPYLANKIDQWEQLLEKSEQDSLEVYKDIILPFNVKLVESRYPLMAQPLSIAYTRYSVSDLYASLEWALHYHLVEDVESILAAVGSMTAEEFSTQINETMRSMGWPLPRKPLPMPAKGKLAVFASGSKAEFSVLFSLMLVREGRKGSLLWRLADEFGVEFTEKIAALRNNRNNKDHGGHVARTQILSFGEAKEFVEAVIHMALPDVTFVEGTTSVSGVDERANNRQRAIRECNELYGRRNFKALPSEVKEHLEQAQIEWDTTDENGNAGRLVREVGAAMQAMLLDALDDFTPRREASPFDVASGRAKALGFTELQAAPFAHLNPERVKRGLAGKVESLAVAGLVLLICGDEDDLVRVSGRFPGIVDFIGEVHETRGHGGESVLLSQPDRKRWHSNLKRFVETLMEVYHG